MSGDEAGGAGMLPLRGGGVAYIGASHNSSSAVYVWEPRGATRLLTPAPQPAAVAGFAPPQLVSFPSADGLFTLHAQLFVARGRPASAGAAPAIIFTHGGAMRQMYGAMHYESTYASLYALNQYMAARGANVLSLNYRSGVGYGRAFRLCEGGSTRCGWQGGLEYAQRPPWFAARQAWLPAAATLPEPLGRYEDVKTARAWLQKTLSPSAVGIHGLSYGGLNCLQALSRDSASYAAGACNAPVFNWITTLGRGEPFLRAFPTGAGFRQVWSLPPASLLPLSCLPPSYLPRPRAPYLPCGGAHETCMP